jgi:hypothetical protein
VRRGERAAVSRHEHLEERLIGRQHHIHAAERGTLTTRMRSTESRETSR